MQRYAITVLLNSNHHKSSEEGNENRYKNKAHVKARDEVVTTVGHDVEVLTIHTPVQHVFPNLSEG